jgi:hypothetical protein
VLTRVLERIGKRRTRTALLSRIKSIRSPSLRPSSLTSLSGEHTARELPDLRMFILTSGDQLLRESYFLSNVRDCSTNFVYLPCACCAPGHKMWKRLARIWLVGQ